MNESIMDRRVRKTRATLRRCLTTLLQTKKIQEITVRELAEMADINRGTFYLHYKDVYDLMEQIENELVTELEQMLDLYRVPDLKAKPSLFFSDLYPLIQKNADIITCLLGENGDLNFVNRLKTMLPERCLRRWLELKTPKDEDTLEAYSAFIVSGCVGIVQYWLESGMKEPAKRMAELTEEFILKGIHGVSE